MNINYPLSEPISHDETLKLSRLAKAGDADARAKLVTHNMGLVVKIAHKYRFAGADIDDLIQTGAIGLMKGVDTFDPDRGYKLSTYVSRCIANEILMDLRKTKRRAPAVSLDAAVFENSNGESLILEDMLGTEPDIVSQGVEMEADVSMMRQATNRLPDTQRAIIAMRYGQHPTTQAEAAVRLGLSQSYVSRQEKKALQTLQMEMRCAL